MADPLRLMCILAHPDDGFGAHVWAAISCHRSQLRDFRKPQGLSEEQRLAMFGGQTLYRAFASVGGGLEVEHDLSAGLR